MKQVGESLREKPIKVINIGLELFLESLVSQGVEAVHVDWRPPAEGDQRMAGLLEKLL
ncbi:MAG: membrane protein FdrA [Syntrophorhabdaceae bacterium PtaU1.Bin034]|jgi:hypothetical protein|nr:MAG: membrane protein FdrA [Syntrophorhabdaceae bacterium PtaU1.Bin034]